MMILIAAVFTVKNPPLGFILLEEQCAGERQSQAQTG